MFDIIPDLDREASAVNALPLTVNGSARSPKSADERPLPKFWWSALQSCTFRIVCRYKREQETQCQASPENEPRLDGLCLGQRGRNEAAPVGFVIEPVKRQRLTPVGIAVPAVELYSWVHRRAAEFLKSVKI